MQTVETVEWHPKKSPNGGATYRDIVCAVLFGQGGQVADDSGKASGKLHAMLPSFYRPESNSGLNLLLTRLERDGYIERMVNGKRTMRITLTPQGWKRAEELGVTRGEKVRIAKPAAFVASSNGKPAPKRKAAAQSPADLSVGAKGGVTAPEPTGGVDLGKLADEMFVRVMNVLKRENDRMLTDEKLAKDNERLVAERDDLRRKFEQAEKNNSTLLDRIKEQHSKLELQTAEINALKARLRGPGHTRGEQLGARLDPQSRAALENVAKVVGQ